MDSSPSSAADVETRSTGAAEPSDSDEIGDAQVRLAFRNAPVGVLGGMIGVPMLGVVMFQARWPVAFVTWAAVTIAVELALLALAFQFMRRVGRDTRHLRTWGIALAAGVAALGACWGSTGVIFFESDPTRVAILTTTLIMLVMSGTAGGASLLSIPYGFNCLVAVPFSVVALRSGNDVAMMAGAATLLMLVVLLGYAHRINALIVSSIRIRFENRGLNEALTEQRVMERTRILEAANRHKSEFLANMSHELRTPLNAIIGFSEILKERMFGDLNDKQLEYVTDINASGHHLLSLINDILDLSKIEAGRLELVIEEFRLQDTLVASMSMVRERAARNGVRLGTTLEPGVETIRGDERKIRQVLLNLLSNAVKFTGQGGEVTVRASRAEGGTRIAVADTGIGIAPEDQQVIFEAFRQVGTDYTRKREGTGLGLSLARRLVEAHGGSISVSSQPGKGSTFSFFIPDEPCPAN